MQTMYRSTTDLAVIRKTPHHFTWGKVITIHDVGAHYTIVEYRDRQEKLAFHVYVDGKDQSVSTNSLDGAMVMAIARKNIEPNEARYMAMGACKLLGVKDDA